MILADLLFNAWMESTPVYCSLRRSVRMRKARASVSFRISDSGTASPATNESDLPNRQTGMQSADPTDRPTDEDTAELFRLDDFSTARRGGPERDRKLVT